ncbi:hypothetical protein HDG69_003404 [Isoptericola halotolerans]|uniref:RiboL-PSP-HEPN domain-containing protein n=1 Tax=Isoptericola halotolerans TaxID=300560 RepID=A0ABX2A7F5_9MICO|nr:hypothetical protein [Isoptericola halotolerans]
MSNHAVPRCCLAPNAPGGADHLPSLRSAFATERPADEGSSPIELSFASIKAIQDLVHRSSSEWSPHYGLILGASAVAAAEDYFRSVLVEIAKACPTVRSRSRDLDVKMSHVLDGSIDTALRSSLDQVSFSSNRAVREWSKKLLGTKVSGDSTLARLLDEFERVCHVRHCATHAGGYVGEGNARVLGVEAGRWISLDSANAVYEILSVVVATIRAYNQFVLESVLSGWLNDGILLGSWGQDKKLFEKVWSVLRCRQDIAAGRVGSSGYPANGYQAYRVVQRAACSRAGGA